MFLSSALYMFSLTWIIRCDIIFAASTQGVKTCVEEVGIGFMMSPNYHPAMKTFAPVRRKLGVKTIFNILGPMLNPAHVSYSVVGVYKEGVVCYYLENGVVHHK